MYSNKIQYLFLAILFLSSCDKIITLPLKDNDTKVIIEGNITDQPGPYIVKLTRSININEPNIYPTINNAIVVIADNLGFKDTLKYSNEGIYKTKSIRGIYGRTYFLEVSIDGKKYTAQSTMPKKVNLDSLRINIFPINGEIQFSIIPVYTDPIELGNGYRFIQKINDTLDNNYNIFNDNLNNGKVNQRPLNNGNEDLTIKLKDIVSVEMQCISASAQLYFFTLSQQGGAGPGGGTVPTNPPNNIVGGALGLFSAHSSQTKQIQIPVN